MRVSWIHFEAPLCYLFIVKILCLYIRRKSRMEWHSGKQKSRTNMHTFVQRQFNIVCSHVPSNN
jgi:hypothetical protein